MLSTFQAARKESKVSDIATSSHIISKNLNSSKQTIDNWNVQQLVRSGILKTKLKISHPNDPYEGEADRISDEVMRMSQETVAPSGAKDLTVYRKCKRCEEEEKKKIHRKTSGMNNLQVREDVAQDIDSLRGRGSPLDIRTRAFMESRFGYDFSQVRIHADAKAVESAQAVNALAYTIGHDIFFGSGQYAPNTAGGRRLIAHELTHVVQQGTINRQMLDKTEITNPEENAEKEAQAATNAVMRGQSFAPTRLGTLQIARQAPSSSPASGSVCGPDATDWFIRQVDAAKRDKMVLAIQKNVTGANRVAAMFGFSAEAIAEGAVAGKVLEEEKKAGLPPRSPEATKQIAASVLGQFAFVRALIAALAPIPFIGAPEQIVLLAIRRAALAWKSLVKTGGRYDFKNDSSTMKGPTSAHCPVDCADTITLCPSSSSDCFQTDVPGNLFYAHVGRFIGWTELTLQLGSEFAQLAATRTWDPPEDTRMISIGFALPDPLTRGDFCTALGSNRSSFKLRSCNNCPETTSAAIK